MKDILCVIPARMASSRFPGKPLHLIKGKPMIERVCRQVSKTGLAFLVATDDGRIMDAVRNFGAEAVMTSAGHLTGTDRCEEAVKEFSRMSGREPHVVINIQGDEPVIDPQQILRLADTFRPDVHEINTLVLPTEIGPDTPVIKDKAFAAVTGDGRALYFSRYTLPYVKSGGRAVKYRHIGIYAYRRDCLSRFVSLPPSALEKSESLEQNRWLENGGTIRVFETAAETLSVDTPEDVIAVERYLESHPDLI